MHAHQYLRIARRSLLVRSELVSKQQYVITNLNLGLCLWQAHEEAHAKRGLFVALVHVQFNQAKLQMAQSAGRVRSAEC